MHDPLTTWLPVTLSLLALGWNFYRDLILNRRKPRLGVRLVFTHYLGLDGRRGPVLLTLSIVNHGPGEACCEHAVVRLKPKAKTPEDQRAWQVLWHDAMGPRSRKLPAFLKVAERIQLVFPESLLDQDAYDRIGILDSYGRLRWAPRGAFDEARLQREEWTRMQERLSEQPKPDPPKGTPGAQNET